MLEQNLCRACGDTDDLLGEQEGEGIAAEQ